MKKFLIFFQIILLLPLALMAQEYAGSEACKTCHSTQHSDWKQSGHPYKIQKLSDGNAPVYPILSAHKTVGSQVDYTLNSGIPNVPEGLNWSDIGFVLGGYHSNARFLDKEGYLILGANRQYNLSTNKWVNYQQADPGKSTYSYSCYRCHTTGPTKTKTTEFEQYPGIEGSWAETGIGCEGCHGPAKNHTLNPSEKPSKDVNCSNCHARDRNNEQTTYPWNERVEWQARTVSGVPTGFIRHREQGDMLLASKHGKFGFTCSTCHDAHKGVYFELGGIKETAKCENCHQNHEISGHEVAKTSAECVDCHMPFAARNGDHLTPYISEQSAHYWNIITDSLAMFANLDTIQSTSNPPTPFLFIKKNEEGLSGLTLDYTCLQCHVDKTVAWASTYAKSMHSGIVSVNTGNEIPSAYMLSQNYPNPFNPTTKINFSLPKSGNVSLKVYSIVGELVETIIDENMQAGRHSVDFNASKLSSGVYIYSITSSNFSYSRKMIFMK